MRADACRRSLQQQQHCNTIPLHMIYSILFIDFTNYILQPIYSFIILASLDPLDYQSALDVGSPSSTSAVQLAPRAGL